MSYTKGEWKRARKTIMLDQGSCFKCTVTSDSKEDPVNPCAGYGLTNVEAMANAQLIAAAPDMVAALEDLMKEIKHRGLCKDVRKDFSLMNYMVQAEKAIAKSKGGQS